MKKLLLLASFLMGFQTLAGVNLKNGNFFISYTFIEATGKGKALDFTATYNSKSTDSGYLGDGWGTPMETKVRANADQSVMIKENGAGGWTLFYDKAGPNRQAAIGSAKKLVRAMMKKNKSLRKQQAKDLFKKLVLDQEYRQRVYDDLGLQVEVADGKVFYSSLRGPQTLKKISSGWLREFGNGDKEYFNQAGHLVKMQRKFGHTITYERNKNNQIVKSVDSFGKQVSFTWTPENYIQTLKTNEKGKLVKFDYKGSQLVRVADELNNVYTFDYDSSSNLKKIGYVDPALKGKKKKSFMEISYYSNNFRTKSVKDRDGDVTKYSYKFDKKNPDMNYTTEVTKKNYLGKWVTNVYKYELKRRADGSQYTALIDTKINNIRSISYYLPNTLPEKIVRGERTTQFTYDKKDRLTRKVSSYKGKEISKVELAYDSKAGKVSKVVTDGNWIKYKYSDDGTVKSITNKKGDAYFLGFQQGKIQRLIAKKNKQAKKEFTIDYNAYEKAKTIAMKGKGKLVFDYKADGTVDLKSTSKNKTLAAEFWTTYGDLEANLVPSGVDLRL